VSHLAFKQPATLREALGISLVVAGVVLLLWAQ
jgi:multidrug transporter EmrE-like cation transporter